jgi:hypothetical protein
MAAHAGAEHPAQSGRQERAALSGRDLGDWEAEARCHRSDCPLWAAKLAIEKVRQQGTSHDVAEDTEKTCLRGFHKTKVSAGSVHIARYLFTQRFHRREFNLVAQSL